MQSDGTVTARPFDAQDTATVLMGVEISMAGGVRNSCSINTNITRLHHVDVDDDGEG
jgi:hypothetical protein